MDEISCERRQTLNHIRKLAVVWRESLDKILNDADLHMRRFFLDTDELESLSQVQAVSFFHVSHQKRNSFSSMAKAPRLLTAKRWKGGPRRFCDLGRSLRCVHARNTGKRWSRARDREPNPPLQRTQIAGARRKTCCGAAPSHLTTESLTLFVATKQLSDQHRSSPSDISMRADVPLTLFVATKQLSDQHRSSPSDISMRADLQRFLPLVLRSCISHPGPGDSASTAQFLFVNVSELAHRLLKSAKPSESSCLAR